MQQIIQVLIDALPIYAQETNHATTVAKADIQAALVTQANLSEDSATLMVTMVERMFASVRVLDSALLKQGKWHFISFRSQLFATALLQTLGDNEQYLVPESFWEVNQYTPKKDAAGDLLHKFEDARKEHHVRQSPQPNRYSPAVVAILKLDNHFFFRKRRNYGNILDTRGDFVHLGGRVNHEDFSGLDIAMDESLQLLQEPEQLPDKTYENALLRTLKRDANLEYPRDYTFIRWQTLLPFCRLSGSSKTYSYTEFHRVYFHLKLTKVGLLNLLREEDKREDGVTRFTLEELEWGSNTKGIKSSKEGFLNTPDEWPELSKQLADMSDSFENTYAFSDKQFVLLLSPEIPLMVASCRKPKDLGFVLNQTQSLMLWGLGAYAKELKISHMPDSINPLAYGWVQISDSALAQQVNSLAALLRGTDYPLIEVAESNRILHFRLSLPPEAIFFDEQAFTLYLQDESLILTRTEYKTPLGTIAKNSKEIPITRSVSRHLYEYCQNKTGLEISAKLYEALRNLPIKNELTAIGLRQLVSQKNNERRICCELIREEMPMK